MLHKLEFEIVLCPKKALCLPQKGVLLADVELEFRGVYPIKSPWSSR